MPNTRPRDDARSLLVSGEFAVLSTLSQEVPGFPFGSVTPYCLDTRGRPVILISELAQHTRNLKADDKASLLVFAGGDDVQASARLTLLGRMAPVVANEVAALAERYYRHFPQCRGHHTELDFSFWTMTVERARFIGGFGRIHWLGADSVVVPNPFDYAAETDIVEHMNADHADALRHYVRGEVAGEAVAMVAIDDQGITLRVGNRRLRRYFPEAVANPGQARAALVRMARETD